MKASNEKMLAALKQIAESMREHPCCLNLSDEDSMSEEELADVGGDEAFVTWNYIVARNAIKEVEGKS